MARYRQLKSLGDYRRAIRNGYGLGVGDSYKPWVKVQDVKSKGLSEKILGIKTGRMHHLLSQGESEFFRLAQF
ncbi:transposase [Kordiimonas sp.]|uniref:transposase n=1 Tax=Kordiimonas sp. TaxID=1970157 RepID=UPI003A952B15